MSSESPIVKVEHSTELKSLPTDAFSPLFMDHSTNSPSPGQEETDYMESMSPESVMDDRPPEDVVLAALAASLSAGDIATAVAASATATNDDDSGEKRPVKKRKSWGQVLPEPKTNLPPRKRAKTADEKEQRRVERVLRNRRAAQSSRERKRLEVEALERRNKELETRITLVERANQILIEELNKQCKNGATPSPVIEALTSSSALTMSSSMFGSQQFTSESAANVTPVTEVANVSSTTVDPASLSPVSTAADATKASQSVSQQAATGSMSTIMAAPANVNESADLTQRPAAMLCDLQCQSAGTSHLPIASMPVPKASRPSQLHSLLIASSALLSVCKRPLTQIAMSLRTGSPLPPTPSILTATVWLVTRPSTRTSTTLTTLSSSTRDAASIRLPTAQASQRRRSSRSRSRTLRFTTLRKILTCSPSLARPLQDATMAVLRLVTKNGNVDQILERDTLSSDFLREDLPNRSGTWISGATLPSKEALLTMLWVLRLEEKRLERGTSPAGSPATAMSTPESRREPLVSANSTTATTSML